MIDVKEYERLSKVAKSATRAADHAKGELTAAMTTLQHEFEVGTLEEAHQLLDTLQAKADEEETTYNETLAEFEEAWGEVINAFT